MKKVRLQHSNLFKILRADSAQSPHQFDYNFYHRVEGICGMTKDCVSKVSTTKEARHKIQGTRNKAIKN